MLFLALASKKRLLFIWKQVQGLINFLILQIITNMEVGTTQVKPKGQQSSTENSLRETSGTVNALQAGESLFYKEFLLWSNLLQLEITDYTIEKEEGFFGSQYTSFVLEVTTDHMKFEVKKRYSDFRKLFEVVSSQQPLTCQFPKKTLFSSKIDHQVSQLRKNLLNEMLLEIISFRTKNVSVFLELLRFIDIKANYEERKIDVNLLPKLWNYEQNLQKLLEQNQLTFTFCVNRHLQVLNSCKEDSLTNIKKVQSLIMTVQKHKARPEDLRLFLLGDFALKGILPLAMNSRNQLVCQAYLRVLVGILSPQKCAFSDYFKKILESLPNKALKFTNLLLESQSFLPSYYLLIRVFLENKYPKQYKQFLLSQIILNQKIRQQFQKWNKNFEAQNFTTYKNQISHKIDSEDLKIIEITNMEQIFIQKKREGSWKFDKDQRSSMLEHQQNFLKQVKHVFSNSQDSCKLSQLMQKNDKEIQYFSKDSRDKKFLHFHFEKLNTDSVEDFYCSLKDWKHNSLVTDLYPNQASKSIIQKPEKMRMCLPGKQERIFKLSKKIMKMPQNLKIAEDKQPKNGPTKSKLSYELEKPELLLSVFYEPFSQETFAADNNFFCFIGLSESTDKRILYSDILYYFHSEKSQKYFKSELEGTTSYMLESFLACMQDSNCTSETVIQFPENQQNEFEKVEDFTVCKTGSFDTQTSSERKQSLQ